MGTERSEPAGPAELSDRTLERDGPLGSRSSLTARAAGAVPERVADAERGRPWDGTGSPPGLVMAELSEYVDCVEDGGADEPSSMLSTSTAKSRTGLSDAGLSEELVPVAPELPDASFLWEEAPLEGGHAADLDTTHGGSECWG